MVDTFFDRFYSQTDYKRLVFHDRIFLRALFKKIGVEKGTVLDVGCGRGYFSNLIAESGDFSVCGIDLSEAGIEHAKKNIDNKNCEFIYIDFLEYSTKNKFDVVFCCQFSPLNVKNLTSEPSCILFARKLLDHLNPEGCLVIIWGTYLKEKIKMNWFHHQLQDYIKFIQDLPLNRYEYYVTNIFEVILLQNLSLNKTLTALNKSLSKFYPQYLPPYRLVILGR